MTDTKEKEKQSNSSESVISFDQMGLKAKLLKGIYGFGFVEPSIVQQQAIILLCSTGKDVIVQAKRGSGKTTALCISVLQRVDETEPNVQALVMVPGRELAQHISLAMRTLGDHMDVKFHICIGGTDVCDDKRKLEGGVQVVVGTPGRVNHMIRMGALKTENIKMLVLDEADLLLSDNIKAKSLGVFQALPENVQVATFYTTMPNEMLEVAKQFMRYPIQILFGWKQISEDIRQFYINFDKEEWKFETLCDLYDTVNITQAVIFCNNRRNVEELVKNMQQKKFTVTFMHDEMDPQERDLIMREFRSGCSRVLIATDILSRVHQHVSVVINYDLPSKCEDYQHRVGCAVQFGRKPGVVINFVSPEERQKLNELESYYSIKIEAMPADIGELI